MSRAKRSWLGTKFRTTRTYSLLYDIDNANYIFLFVNKILITDPPSAASLKAIPQKVVKKNVVTLLCSVDNPGRPENITYVWYRGNHHISDITTANWTINPVTFETKSNYTCYASNEGGSGAAASVFVNVTGKRFAISSNTSQNLFYFFEQLRQPSFRTSNRTRG